MGCGASKQTSDGVASSARADVSNALPVAPAAAPEKKTDASVPTSQAVQPAAHVAPATESRAAPRASSAGAKPSAAAKDPAAMPRRATGPAGIPVTAPSNNESAIAESKGAGEGTALTSNPAAKITPSASRTNEEKPKPEEEQPEQERPRPVKSRYINVGPPSDLLAAGVTESPMFEDAPTSQLYQYEKGDLWYFYNDARDCDAIVEFVFDHGSSIEPLGNTVLEKVDEGLKCTLRVHPGETEPFVKGTPRGYSSAFSTEDIEESYLAKKRAENKAAVEKAIAAVRAIAGDSKDPFEVLSKCIEHSVPFVDLFFTPEDSSNFRDGTDPAIPPTTWQRPSEYLTPEWSPHVRVFSAIDPNDIDQGALGDCYFLCSLACIAEHPDLVKDLFSHDEGEKKRRQEARIGAHRVYLNNGGWWTTYLLDNYFPTMSNVPYYARNREDPAELWVQLLEKAQAKAHGSYSAITGGDPLQALQDLTGYPITRLDKTLSEKDASSFARVHRWANQKALIALSTPSAEEVKALSGADVKTTKARYEKAGLPLGHSYALLNAVSVDGVSLVQIRNPWGNNVEWTGKWHDKDPLWNSHPNVAKACGFAPSDDGTFWMEWDDTMQYFASGGVCFLRSGWFDYRIRAFASNGVPNMALRVTVTKKVEVFLTVHQKDRRGELPSSPDYEYASFLIAVSRSAGGTKQKIHMHSTLDLEEPTANPSFVTGRDVAMRYVFEPEHCPYVVAPRIMEKISKSFVLGLIADTSVGDGLSVSFIDLSPSCPLYENYDLFDLKDGAKSLTAEYQYNPEEGAPATKRGTAIEV